MWEEFKRFAIKGNALELAVAVVVGNAFGQIVNSLVGDIITPLLGLLTGQSHTDFKNLALVLQPASTANGVTTPALVVSYGLFLQSIFNFIVIAGSIFLFFKFFAMLRQKFFATHEDDKTPEAEKSSEERLLEEIRDILKEKDAR